MCLATEEEFYELDRRATLGRGERERTETSSMYTTVENSSQVILSRSKVPGVSHSSRGRIELWNGDTGSTYQH